MQEALEVTAPSAPIEIQDQPSPTDVNRRLASMTSLVIDKEKTQEENNRAQVEAYLRMSFGVEQFDWQRADEPTFSGKALTLPSGQRLEVRKGGVQVVTADVTQFIEEKLKGDFASRSKWETLVLRYEKATTLQHAIHLGWVKFI